MSQDYNLPTGSTTVRDNLIYNSANSLEALRSSFSGANAPTNPTPVAGQLYWDSPNSQLKLFNGTSWNTLLHGTFQWIDASDYVDLNTAVANSANKTLLIITQVNVSANLTIPANVGLLFFYPGVISHGSYTIDIAGHTNISSCMWAVFNGTGTVTVSPDVVDGRYIKADFIVNPHFDFWSYGTDFTNPTSTTQIANAWYGTLNGASYSVAKYTGYKKYSSQSCRINVTTLPTTSWCGITQSVDVGVLPIVQGRSIILSVVLKASTSSLKIRIAIDDGVTSTVKQTTITTGWTIEKITHTFNPSATKFSVEIGVDSTSSVVGTLYVDSVFLYWSYLGSNDLRPDYGDKKLEAFKAGVYGVGSYDYSSLAAAITAIGSTPTTLILATVINASNSAEAVVVPSTLSLFPMRGGMIAKGSATSLTINSAPVGNPMHQWLSGFAAGEVICNPAKVEKVYPDYWGTNTTPGTTDMTTAIKCALASRPPVQCLGTTYGHTGGLQLGVASRVLRGVSIGLESEVYSIPQVGTILKKLSGTLDSLTVLQSPYTLLEDITFDGNNLGGRQLYTYASGAEGNRLRFINQGGTDYAFHYSGNTSMYNHIEFAGGNYGGLKCDTTVNGIYGTFNKIVAGELTGTAGYQILINGGTNLEFNGINLDTLDGGIKLTGYLHDVTMNNVATECFPQSVTPIIIDGTGTSLENVSINGLRIREAPTAVVPSPPMIQIIEAKTIKIDNFYFERNNADVSTIIELDNVENLEVNGVTVSNNISDTKFIECVTACDRISLTNTENHSGSPLNIWKGTNIAIKNSDFRQTFLTGSNYISCENVSGDINTTNATAPFTAINCSSLNDAAGIAGTVKQNPKFSAHKNASNQTVTSGVMTKLTFGTELYDYGSAYDASNSKWTPGVSGIAHINIAALWTTGVDLAEYYLYIYKNGAGVVILNLTCNGTGTQQQTMGYDLAVDEDDYIEIYVAQSTGGDKVIEGAAYRTYFTGHMLQ